MVNLQRNNSNGCCNNCNNNERVYDNDCGEIKDSVGKEGSHHHMEGKISE